MYHHAYIRFLLSINPKISTFIVENVVKPPNIPTPIIKYAALIVDKPYNMPNKNEPNKLINNVAVGQIVREFFLIVVVIKYRKTDPKAAPIPTK